LRRILALISVAALMVALVAVPALAQPQQRGLVNVNITDVLTNNEVAVQIPIGVAANVCGVQANVLARGGVQEPIDCTASTTADLPVAFRP
jgi:hypothetical protein